MPEFKNIAVGLVQIGNEFGNQYYIPYSIGLLQAYAQKCLKNPEKFSFLPPIYKKIRVDQAVASLNRTNIVLFSTYNWNFKLSLEIAKRLKEENDDCVIVFGGPQVPEAKDRLRELLVTYPFIDICCYSEGEVPSLRILENVLERKWIDVPAIGYMDGDGQFKYNTANARITNLNEIPSPYLDGVFDMLFKENPTENWSALLETNRGCPFSCTYCYWGANTRNKVYQYNLDRVFNEIDWISKRGIEFVVCCDANFGMLKRDIDIAKRVAENKIRYGYPEAFSVQNTKNSTDKIYLLQKILNDAGLQKGVNLALQSVNKNTLRSISRSNIGNDTFVDLQLKFTKNGISTFTDMIIGLPEESYDTFVDGVSQIISNGQHNRIQFINLTVLENTLISDLEYKKKYGLIIGESTIVPHHTSLESGPEVHETQRLVFGTNKMPKKDWVRTRVFCWITSLLYFNKLLQIPFIVLNRLYSISYRELLGLFTSKSEGYHYLSEITGFFVEKAEDIQNGGSEYVASQDWLNIWWPTDEYIFIKLCKDDLLESFYAEAETSIRNYLNNKNIVLPPMLLENAVMLNRNMVKQPFVQEDIVVSLEYNLIDIYQGVLKGMDIHLQERKVDVNIDRTTKKWATWEQWYKEVVWYGTKKGAYLYDATTN